MSDEYYKVSTRMIAEQASANSSMISYYFGNKEGLYEEMIREALHPLLEVLDGQTLTLLGGFKDLLHLYYDTMATQPEFPKLFLKVPADFKIDNWTPQPLSDTLFESLSRE